MEKEGNGDRLRILAKATAEKESLIMLNEVLSTDIGLKAMKMRLTENYISQLNNLAKPKNCIIMSKNINEITSVLNYGEMMMEKDK